MVLPLDGIKVFVLSRTLPGALCTQILIEYGAEVIRIEDAANDPMLKTESMILDFSKEEDKTIFKSMVVDCDVLVDVFRPGIMESWGLGYHELKHINNRIIYCALNDFESIDEPGNTVSSNIVRENAQKGSCDGILAMSEVQIAGAGIIAILTALLQRNKSGVGLFCEVSFLDGSFNLLS